MRKKIMLLCVLAVALGFLPGAVRAAEAAMETTSAAALTAALSWLYEDAPSPGFDDEWAVIALARAGVACEDWLEAYLYALYETLSAGGGPEALTDFARVALALSALGIDAANFRGHNLLAPFATVPDTARTLNADIFALLALDARIFPQEGAQAAYVDVLLAGRLGPGWGWGWMPAPDADLTAMAIQALAPYYAARADVREAVGLALAWLDEQALHSAEERAQLILALTALGRYTEASPHITALLTFRDAATGGFFFTWDGVSTVNTISTVQAAHALVAYSRARAGLNPFFAMQDAFRPGDVNADGKVCLQDVVALAQYLAGHDVRIHRPAAMVTAGTRSFPDLRDVLRIRRYLANHPGIDLRR